MRDLESAIEVLVLYFYALFMCLACLEDVKSAIIRCNHATVRAGGTSVSSIANRR